MATVNLRVVRDTLTTDYTLGKLYVDGVYFCETCEDRDRFLENPMNQKVPGESAIPVGHYRVIIDDSKRFGRPMPHVLNVKNFEGIRIHQGNTADDTEGCLLLGMVRGRDRVIDSRTAFKKFMEMLIEVIRNGDDVWITYERAEG